MATRAKRRTTTKNKSRYNEIVAIILVAFSLLILLCLVSYHPSDWSFNTSSSESTQNWVGVVGSIIADFLFQAVGLMAYILPVLFLVIAWKCFQSSKLYIPKGRLLGFVLFVLSGTGLLTLFSFYGGVTGAFAEQVFTSLIGTIGSGILLTAFFLASILLITNLSYASFFESLKMGWENLQFNLKEWFSKYRKWQEEGEKEASERIKQRNELRKEVSKKEAPKILSGGAKAAKKAEVQAEDTNQDSITEKVSAVIKRLGEPPETVDAKAKEIEGSASLSGKELPIERAKAVGANDLSGVTDLSKDSAGNQPKDLVADSNKISVNPIAKTGELDESLVSENGAKEDSKPPEPKKPKTPQDFRNYILPKPEFLTVPPPRIEYKEEELQETAVKLTETAEEFNVKGHVKNINLGPVVTTYEFKPDPGVKYARVTGLADDLCLALKAESIRIERIPGKAVVGMEIPNKERETIFLRDVIDSKEFKASESKLTIALGKVIDGHRRVADLAKMPHLLIAGATGAGKSVGVNSLIVSILYKAKPDEVKFIMVDPKRLELGLYADIPHLATPIITDPKRAAISLRWAVSEMERRYKELAGWGVRNIAGFNKEVKRRNSLRDYDEEGNPHNKLPFIVIIIDELADLMMVSGKEVETSITRLAQMARAVGIHLVLATQRPSVDVITGLIKANFPSRISFRVSSKTDSRTIIDANGAERLLGKGDMLFLPPGTSHLIRVHGTYVDEKEIHQIVSHIKSQGNPDYDENITKSEEEKDDFGDLPGRKDDLFGDALRTVVNAKRASTSLLQRHLRIGYGRAAAILDALVADGFIGEMDGSKRARPVTQKAYEALQEMEEGREF